MQWEMKGIYMFSKYRQTCHIHHLSIANKCLWIFHYLRIKVPSDFPQPILLWIQIHVIKQVWLFLGYHKYIKINPTIASKLYL